MKKQALFSLCVALLLAMVLPTVGASDAIVAQDIETEMETSSEPVDVVINLEEVNLGGLTTQQMRRQHARSSQQTLLDHIESIDGIRVLNRFWITNSVLVEIDPEYDYERLTRIDGVRSLKPNTRMELLHASSRDSQNTTAGVFTQTSTNTNLTTTTSTDATYGMEQINATDVWSQYDTKGGGIKVAVLDTGVNISHPDLELHTTDSSDPTYPGGWAEFDNYGNKVSDSMPHDTGSHGTHVSGTVAGEHTGVAPNVSLMHALVIDGANGGTYAQAIGGLQWAVENDADVVSMSIGGPADSRWIDAVENANQMGTVVIAAIGNYNEGDGKSSTPGNVYDVISVGAVDNNLDVTTFSGGELIDTDSTWATSAPDDWPSKYLVPDVVAAGVFVNSTSSFGGYEMKSGTSMATPHVAGATALALSAAGDKSPDSVSDAFALTAFGSGSVEPGTRYGHGAADALGVTEHLLDDASVSGTVTDTTGTPLEEAEVSVDGLQVGTSSGEYDINLESGSWTLEASAPGYQDTTETVTLGADETVNNDIALEQNNPLPDFDVTIDATNSPVKEGESLIVDATVENTGGQSDTQTVSLSVGGTERNTTTVELSSGDTTTETFEWKTEDGDAGDYTVTVETENETDTAPVTVISGASFDVTIDNTNSPVNEGEALITDVTVKNTGDVKATKTLELNVGGSVQDSTDIMLEGGQSQSVQLSWTTGSGDSGEYTATVETDDDSDAAPVKVSSEANFEVSIENTNSPIIEGETLEIESTVKNTGNKGAQTVSLEVGGEKRDSSAITLENNNEVTRLFEWNTENGDVGDYTATIKSAGDVADKAVTVYSSGGPNSPPVASFNYTPDSPDTTDTIYFDASESSDSGGSIQTYEWDFDGDGNAEYSSSSPTVSHSYSSPGEYTVELTVTDDDGATDTATQTVSVSSTDDGGGIEGTISNIQTTLSDTDGDGLDDSITVDVSVEEDGGVTSVQFDGPFSLDLSETDESQSTVINIDNNQQKVSFVTIGEYTGTYTVEGTLSGQSDGDIGKVTAWIGDVSQGSAGEVAETQFTVESDTSPPSSGVSIDAPETASPESTFEVKTSVEEDGGATVVQFDSPFSLDLSETDEGQASVVSINNDQPKEKVVFGSTGYTGTYTVDVKLEGGSDGDSIDIASWIGDLDRTKADAETTESVGVSAGTPNPFLDPNGQTLGELEVVQMLVSWNEDGQIDGESYGELELVQYLVEWNEAK